MSRIFCHSCKVICKFFESIDCLFGGPSKMLMSKVRELPSEIVLYFIFHSLLCGSVI